jgi:hypothetical protein
VLTPSGRSDALERAERSWKDLDQLVGPLSDEQLARPGRDGWAIKDHLAHLAAWELSLVALLEGRDRPAAMGVPDAARLDTDELNARLFTLHRDLPPAGARALLKRANDQVRAALARLSDEDLQRPYSHYQPGAEHASSADPVIGWVAGNTFDHVDEHRHLIVEMIP